jgi:hypothetical protein
VQQRGPNKQRVGVAPGEQKLGDPPGVPLVGARLLLEQR